MGKSTFFKYKIILKTLTLLITIWHDKFSQETKDQKLFVNN